MKLDLHPTRRRLLEFSLTLAAVSLIIGAVQLSRGEPWITIGLWAGGGVGLALVCALIAPVGRLLYQAAMVVAFPIGFAVSHLLMALIFFAFLMPLGLGRRLLGRDPLARQLEPNAQTYWTSRSPARESKRYFRQY